ncbi:MAG TPA: ribulose-phosphate 3-epimerase [candidate division WOR-3 bacterium]|uniref:Ribulose-phosphate 3-epimerase n=1 Tax=candidate division WOR-3 bacterium TaxID=2052148 RepID=A0A9C9EM93_UNCW3|nr:ribulose-phosphate 3-epimerase [candidate division WOR-3 bacterium]
MKVAPSIIAADFSRFHEEIAAVEKAGADLLHLDVMDGVFVPNLTFGPMIVEAINRISSLELDAHLMIVNPERYLDQYIKAGVDWLSFHVEATEKPEYCIQYIKEQDIKVGIALNPETPFENIKKFVERLDYLLVMTVHPGFCGQKFLSEVVDKIKEIRNWIEKQRLECILEVDGGINDTNCRIVRQAGADIIVAGAGIFKKSDYKKAIENLRC